MKNRKPTKTERLAHEITLARLFPDTAGKCSSVAPCRCCGARGLELGPGPNGESGWCTPCANDAWDRAAHRQAFGGWGDDQTGPSNYLDQPWSDADW